MKIRPFTLADGPQVQSFTDRAIGQNYYSAQELEKVYTQSLKNGEEFTLVLVDDEDNSKVYGVRITYPPGNWQKGKGSGLSPHLWGVDKNEVAYFQSLFIDPALTHQGWGKKMSLEAIARLKTIGTKAIVTHSWKESPNNSSGKYLRSLGFELVATHPLYWHEVDYVCTRCGKPCVCTGEEMILRFP